jgi:hypothetical protein
MAENPQPLTATTINAIQTNAALIANIAATITSATGVAVTAPDIAAPVAREMNKTQIDYPAALGLVREGVVSSQWQVDPATGVLEYAGPATNDSLMQNYAEVQSQNLTNKAVRRMSLRRADWSRRRNPPSQPTQSVEQMCYSAPHAELSSRDCTRWMLLLHGEPVGAAGNPARRPHRHIARGGRHDAAEKSFYDRRFRRPARSRACDLDSASGRPRSLNEVAADQEPICKGASEAGAAEQGSHRTRRTRHLATALLGAHDPR